MKNRNGWYEMYGHLCHHVNGKIHNKNSPAEIWEEGCKFWYQNHKRHRLDGPAMEFSNREKYWWYQGKKIECQSQQEFERYLKLKLLW